MADIAKLAVLVSGDASGMVEELGRAARVVEDRGRDVERAWKALDLAGGMTEQARQIEATFQGLDVGGAAGRMAAAGKGLAAAATKELGNKDLFKGVEGGRIHLDLLRPEDIARARQGGKEIAAEAKKIEEALHPKSFRESLSDRISGALGGAKLANGLKDFAGMAKTGLGVAKDATELLKGKFDSTGEAMAKLGDIAGAIPGPWGAAASAVLTVGGQIVDYFQGPLLKAQAAAREGFMAIASGAKTIPQALSDIKLGAMTEGIERMVRRQQDTERGGFATMLTFSPERVAEHMLGQNMTADQLANLDALRIAGQARQRQRMLRDLLRNPYMQVVRGDMASEQAEQGLVDMRRAPEQQNAQRTVTRSLRGESGFNELAVQSALVTIALDRFRSQGLEPTAAQEEKLREEARRTTAVLQAQAGALATDRIVQGLQQEIATLGLSANALAQRQLRVAGVDAATREYVRTLQTVRDAGQFVAGLNTANEALSMQVATFGMSTRAAQIHQAVLARNDLAHRASNIQTQQGGWLSRGFATALQAQARARLADADAALEQMRANDEALAALERLQRLRQQAEQMAQQLRTPLETYNDALTQAAGLWEAAWANQTNGVELYGRAVARAADQLLAAAQLGDRLAGVATEGSSAAASAYNRYQRSGQGQDRWGQLLAAVQQQQRLQQEQARELREIRGLMAAGRILGVLGLRR